MKTILLLGMIGILLIISGCGKSLTPREQRAVDRNKVQKEIHTRVLKNLSPAELKVWRELRKDSLVLENSEFIKYMITNLNKVKNNINGVSDKALKKASTHAGIIGDYYVTHGKLKESLPYYQFSAEISVNRYLNYNKSKNTNNLDYTAGFSDPVKLAIDDYNKLRLLYGGKEILNPVKDKPKKSFYQKYVEESDSYGYTVDPKKNYNGYCGGTGNKIYSYQRKYNKSTKVYTVKGPFKICIGNPAHTEAASIAALLSATNCACATNGR